MAGRPAPAPRPHRLPLALALQSPLPLLPATSHPSATGASRSQQPPPRRVWRNGTVGGRTQQETENRGILALLSRPLPPPPALHRSAPSAHVADTSVPGRIKEDSAATASAKSASSGEDVAAKRGDKTAIAAAKSSRRKKEQQQQQQQQAMPWVKLLSRSSQLKKSGTQQLDRSARPTSSLSIQEQSSLDLCSASNIVLLAPIGLEASV
uniref:Uncharacterized protein n=1 Tax=Oryza rufipogon TaxID=4529 RepID=A0A0E0QJ45_ORYRU